MTISQTIDIYILQFINKKINIGTKNKIIPKICVAKIPLLVKNFWLLIFLSNIISIIHIKIANSNPNSFIKIIGTKQR